MIRFVIGLAAYLKVEVSKLKNINCGKKIFCSIHTLIRNSRAENMKLPNQVLSTT